MSGARRRRGGARLVGLCALFVCGGDAAGAAPVVAATAPPTRSPSGTVYSSSARLAAYTLGAASARGSALPAPPVLAAQPGTVDWCARPDVADEIEALAAAGAPVPVVAPVDPRDAGPAPKRARGGRSSVDAAPPLAVAARREAAARAKKLRAERAKDGRTRACLDVLVARAALAAGEAKDAAARIASAEGVLGEIAPSLRVLRARALVAANQPDDALALIDEAKDGAVGPLDVAVLRALERVEADALIADDRFADAVSRLQELAKEKAEPPVLARLVDAAQLAGAGDVVSSTRRELLRAFPGSDEARMLEPLLDAGALKLSAAAQATRLENLLRAGRADRAGVEARANVVPPGTSFDDVAALEVQITTALVRAGFVDEAVARTARAAADPATPDAVKEVHAWALGKARRTDEASATYAALSASTKDPTLKAEACFYSAFELYDGAEEAAGAASASTATARPMPAPTTAAPATTVPTTTPSRRATTAGAERARADARFAACEPVVKDTPWAPQVAWYRAWIAILDGAPARALPLLAALAQTKDRDQLKHRWWLAHVEDATGARAAATSRFRAIADEAPTEWYGLLARRRVGGAPAKGAVVAPDALAKLVPDDEGAKKARLLRGLGFVDDARAVVRARGGSVADVALAHAIGDPHFGYRKGGALLPVPAVKGGALRGGTSWRASYAAPWRPVVDEHCEGKGVPSSFAYAIMRTESGFDPRAVSVAGARGLLQLMPAVARKTAGLVGKDEAYAARLFDPPVAVALGCTVLGTHLREFGAAYLAAAAYNGSPDSVARWMQAFGALPPERFVERIPFKETREYVKRVLAVAAVYRALDGEPLALDLPSSIGPPPSSFTTFPPWAEAPSDGGT